MWRIINFLGHAQDNISQRLIYKICTGTYYHINGIEIYPSGVHFYSALVLFYIREYLLFPPNSSRVNWYDKYSFPSSDHWMTRFSSFIQSFIIIPMIDTTPRMLLFRPQQRNPLFDALFTYSLSSALNTRRWPLCDRYSDPCTVPSPASRCLSCAMGISAYLRNKVEQIPNKLHVTR